MWLVPKGMLTVLALIGMDAWAGGLLCFFAGVRRGLTFSERRGGAWREVATFLLLFFAGVAGIALAQPLLLALGFVGAGAAGVLAARRGEAPSYFARLRPSPMRGGGGGAGQPRGQAGLTRAARSGHPPA